jgi:hypothetical protein
MLLLTAAKMSETFLSGGGDCVGEKLIRVKQGFSLPAHQHCSARDDALPLQGQPEKNPNLSVWKKSEQSWCHFIMFEAFSGGIKFYCYLE